MKAIGIIACTAIASSFAHGGERTAEELLKRAPAAVQSTVREQARGGRLEDFETITIDGKTIYIAETDRPHDLKIYVAESGALIKVREDIPVSKTPAAVLETARGLGGVIDEVTKETSGTSETYRVEIDRKGMPDLDLVVTPGGRIVSQSEDADD